MDGDILAFDLDRAQPAVDRRKLAHQIQNGGLVLLDLLVGLVELKLPVAKGLLTLIDLPAMVFQFCGEPFKRFGFAVQRSARLRPASARRLA